jgi:mannan endo-1,4-beta-mannosidase
MICTGLDLTGFKNLSGLLFQQQSHINHSRTTINNMANVLKVKGSKIFDPCGKPIMLRGVSKMFIFEADLDKRIGVNIIPEIAKSGANCVRIVWGMGRMDNGTVVASSVPELDMVIMNCKVHKMIPIIGLWDFTDAGDGGFSRVSDYTNFWIRPDVLAVLKKHENAIIIGIGNEAAEECDDSDADLNLKMPSYISVYSTAIQTLRNAGIKSPLMLDGMDRGKSLKCFSFVRAGQSINVAKELLNVDTEKNLIFSFHPYWAKSDTDGQTFVEDIFNQAVADGFCFVIGELSKYGAFVPAPGSICDPAGEVDYRRFAKLCAKNKVGYVLWEWGPGNEFNNPACIKMNMTTNGTFAGLKDWGLLLVKNTVFGFKVAGRFTNYTRSSFLRCTP